MRTERFTTADGWTAATAALVGECCERDAGTIGIALSGGSTPRPHYAAIAAASLPFDRIQLWQVDERCVPSHHPDSNAGMIELAMGTALRQLGGWRPFDTALPADQAASAYEADLRERTAPFALAILGIGPDGHIASLFPGCAALHETTKLTAHTTTDAFAVHDRLSLTLPPILESRTILLLADTKKLPVLDELEHGSKSIDAFPAAALREHADLRVHLLQN